MPTEHDLTIEEVRGLLLDLLDSISRVCDKHGLRYYLVGGSLLGAVRHQGFIPWDDDIDVALPRPDFTRFLQVCSTELPHYHRLYTWPDNSKFRSWLTKLHDTRTTIAIDVDGRPNDAGIGVNVDIFPLDGVPKSRFLKHRQYLQVRWLRRLSQGFSGRRPLESRIAYFARALAFIVASRWQVRLRARLEVVMRRHPFEDSEEVCNFLGAYGEREYFPVAWVGEGHTAIFEGRRLPVFAAWESYLRHIYGDYQALPPVSERVSRHGGSIRWRRPPD